jgi:hypothetical protein
MDLCPSCLAFDIHAFSLDQDQMRGYKCGDAMKAAKEGCKFCSLLLEIARENYPNLDPESWLHLQLSRDYGVGPAIDVHESGPQGLQYNSLRILVGSRMQRLLQNSAKYCNTKLRVLADQSECPLTYGV